MVIIKLISVNLPESYLNVIEVMVSEGKFPNRSEAIRVAIRDLVKTEYMIEETIKNSTSSNLLEQEFDSEVSETFLA